MRAQRSAALLDAMRALVATRALVALAIAVGVLTALSSAAPAAADVDDFSYSSWSAQYDVGLDAEGRAVAQVTETLAARAESVNDTSKKSLANWYVNNLACALDGLSLLDQTVRTEKHNTDLAGFQVHAHALDTGGEPGED